MAVLTVRLVVSGPGVKSGLSFALGTFTFLFRIGVGKFFLGYFFNACDRLFNDLECFGHLFV